MIPPRRCGIRGGKARKCNIPSLGANCCSSRLDSGFNLAYKWRHVGGHISRSIRDHISRSARSHNFRLEIDLQWRGIFQRAPKNAVYSARTLGQWWRPSCVSVVPTIVGSSKGFGRGTWLAGDEICRGNRRTWGSSRATAAEGKRRPTPSPDSDEWTDPELATFASKRFYVYFQNKNETDQKLSISI